MSAVVFDVGFVASSSAWHVEKRAPALALAFVERAAIRLDSLAGLPETLARV